MSLVTGHIAHADKHNEIALPTEEQELEFIEYAIAELKRSTIATSSGAPDQSRASDSTPLSGSCQCRCP